MKPNLTEVHDSLFLRKTGSKIPNIDYDNTKILKEFFKESIYETNEPLETNNNKSNEVISPTVEAANLYRWKLFSLLYSNIYKVGDIPPPTSIQTYKDYLLCGTKNGNILVFNENEFLILQLKLSTKNDQNGIITNIRVSNDGKVVSGCTSSGLIILWNLASIEDILMDEITEVHEYQVIKPKIPENCSYSVVDFEIISENNSLFVTYEIMSQTSTYESYIYNITEKEEGNWFSKRTETFIDTKKVIFNANPSDYYSTKVLDIKINEKSLLFVAVVLQNELKIISLSNRDYILTPVLNDGEESDIVKLHEWHKTENNENNILGSSMKKVLRLFYYSTKKGNLNYDKEISSTFDENITQLKFISSTLVLVVLESGSFSLFDTELSKAISSNMKQFGSLQTEIAYSEEYGILFVTNRGVLSGKILSWQNIILQELRLKGPESLLEFLGKICLDNSNTMLRKMFNLDDENLNNNNELKNTFSSLVNSFISRLKNSNTKTPGFTIFLTIAKLDYFFNLENLNIGCQLIDEEFIQNNEAVKKLLCQSISSIIIKYGKEGSYFPPKLVNFVLENSLLLEDNQVIVEQISTFDISCFDIDFVLRTFIANSNFKACASIWASVLDDIYTPIEDMMCVLSGDEQKSSVFGDIDQKEIGLITETLFWFLNRILNTNKTNLFKDVDVKRKNIYSFLLSATTSRIDESREIVSTKNDPSNEPMYPYLTYMLQLDSVETLKILETYIGHSSEISLQLLNTFTFLLESMISTGDYSTKTIKLLGLFVTLHLEDNKSKYSRKNRFVLLYQSLTISDDYPTQSEAALLKLLEIFGIESLSEENMILLNDLEYKRCLLWIGLNQEKYMDCIKLSLDLNMPAVFDFIEIFYEQKNEDTMTTNNESAIVEMNLNSGTTSEMVEYEIEETIYSKFESFYNIDKLKAVELIYFYDYDIKTIFKNIDDKKMKIDIIKIIIDDSRFQVPNFLCGFYIKSIFEVYDDNDENIKKVESLIENVSLNSGNFKDVVSELKTQNLGNLVVKVYREANKMDEALSETLKELDKTLKKKDTKSMNNLETLITETFTTCRKGDKKELWSKFIKFILKVYENSEFEDIKEMTMDTLSKICFSLTTEQFGDLNFSIVDVFVDVLETREILLSKSHDVSDSLMHVSKILNIEMVFYKALLKLFNKESEDLANVYNLSKLKGLLATYKECDICGEFNIESSGSKVRYFTCGHLMHDACNTKIDFISQCGLCEI